MTETLVSAFSADLILPHHRQLFCQGTLLVDIPCIVVKEMPELGKQVSISIERNVHLPRVTGDVAHFPVLPQDLLVPTLTGQKKSEFRVKDQAECSATAIYRAR